MYVVVSSESARASQQAENREAAEHGCETVGVALLYPLAGHHLAGQGAPRGLAGCLSVVLNM